MLSRPVLHLPGGDHAAPLFGALHRTGGGGSFDSRLSQPSPQVPDTQAIVVAAVPPQVLLAVGFAAASALGLGIVIGDHLHDPRPGVRIWVAAAAVVATSSALGVLVYQLLTS